MPFRAIADRLEMSLVAVQKSVRGAQKLADAIPAAGDLCAEDVAGRPQRWRELNALPRSHASASTGPSVRVYPALRACAALLIHGVVDAVCIGVPIGVLLGALPG